jgi:hypothetical protein
MEVNFLAPSQNSHYVEPSAVLSDFGYWADTDWMCDFEAAAQGIFVD